LRFTNDCSSLHLLLIRRRTSTSFNLLARIRLMSICNLDTRSSAAEPGSTPFEVGLSDVTGGLVLHQEQPGTGEVASGNSADSVSGGTAWMPGPPCAPGPATSKSRNAHPNPAFRGLTAYADSTRGTKRRSPPHSIADATMLIRAATRVSRAIRHKLRLTCERETTPCG
ncbi:hypothetical protein TGDOM2_401910, partial [Toxoplasma gondii GAB2-2007-GAL-DOM2]